MRLPTWTTLAWMILATQPWPGIALAQQEGDSRRTVVAAEDLREDLAILDRALNELHPGLHRYTDAETLRSEFEALRQQLSRDTPLDEVYLAVSRYLARIKCGHTYANFWNQPDSVHDELLGGANKVPFAFRFIEGRMYVTADATEQEVLERGTEVVSMNGVSVADILVHLLPLVKADGSNDAKRMRDLEISGAGKFEPFDVYFPLSFPVTGGVYELEVIPPGSPVEIPLAVEAVTREQRRERLNARYGELPQRPEELWQFEVLDASTAYLRLGTFVTWKMEMNWKKFLREAFDTLREEEIPHLILDIRGNEGGADEVTLELTKYLVTKPIQLTSVRELMRYAKVPEDLNAYLNTWDDSFRDRRKRVVETEDGFFTWRKASKEGRQLRPGKRNYAGKTYLLVDAANSSATFILAVILKDNDLATLVGQTTGGNRRGINGGEMFFLRLPNSKIEVDVPLIGYYRGDKEPDGGVSPDLWIEPSPSDITSGVDAELEAARRLIAGGD